MSYDYEKSEYVNMYVDSMTDRILKIHPTWNEEKVRNTIFKKFKEQSQNPVVIMDNNYTHESQDATMLSVIDWAIAREPIVAGNATFYKTHHEAINPIASMLDGMLKRRKAFKKESSWSRCFNSISVGGTCRNIFILQNVEGKSCED